MENNMDNVKNVGTKHPIAAAFVYYVIMGALIPPIKTQLQSLFGNWATEGLFGGLFSFNTIKCILLIVICFALAAIVAYIFVTSGIPEVIYQNHPKGTRVFHKIFGFLISAYSFLTILMLCVNIYKVFISGSIDGYRADIAMIFYNIIPYLFGCIVFVAVSIIFSGATEDVDK